METRNKAKANTESTFCFVPTPVFKRISMEQLEKEMETVDYYDENGDDDVSSFSSLSFSTESGTEYDSVATADMSWDEEEIEETRPSDRTVEHKSFEKRCTKRIIRSSTSDRKRVTRSTKVEDESVERWNVKEEPFKKVDPVEFMANMDLIDPYAEDEDEDFEMADSDSDSGTDYDSVMTEDLSEDEEIEGDDH